MFLSDRVNSMQPSATIRMAELARKLKGEGRDIISLSLGEPDFDTPEFIKTAAKNALDQGFTKYTAVPGHLELRQAISQKFKRENNLDYAPEQIVVSNGAKQSVANLAQALLNPGDEAIIFAPYWVSYADIIRFNGGTPIPILADISQDFKVNAEQLKAAITDKTRFILFSSPCNPTGSVFERDELETLVEVLRQHPDIIVIADEIYEYINFTDEHVSIGSLEGMQNRTVTINGMSKGYAMTGWRLGYMGAPLHIAEACSKIQGQCTSGATSFGQMAAVTALNSDGEAHKQMKAAFRRRRDLMIEKLNQIKGLKVNHPKGAFYLFPDMSELIGKTCGETVINNGADLAEYLLQAGGVATVGGNAFGIDNCFRISYAASEAQLLEACVRIKTAIEALD